MDGIDLARFLHGQVDQLQLCARRRRQLGVDHEASDNEANDDRGDRQISDYLRREVVVLDVATADLHALGRMCLTLRIGGGPEGG